LVCLEKLAGRAETDPMRDAFADSGGGGPGERDKRDGGDKRGGIFLKRARK